MLFQFARLEFDLFRSLSEDKHVSVSEVSAFPLSLRLMPKFPDVMFDMDGTNITTRKIPSPFTKEKTFTTTLDMVVAMQRENFF